MCGFVGIFSDKPQSLPQDFFESALRAIHHRGPDSSSTWFDPHGHVGLGCVRLGSASLGNDTHPIVADEGDLVLMVDGEFYGHKRIREELEKKGCRFKTSSGSETALHLYRVHGIRALNKLRGEFSMLLYDRARRQLVAVRDRIGVKPLYYAHHHGAWYFASEIKALLAVGIPAKWDEESYANRQFVLRNGTLFDKVKSVQPGSWLIVDQSGSQTEQYWDWTFPAASQEIATTPESEQIDSLRSAIQESVQLRLQADSPIGVCVSGGLDSSAMLGMCTALTGKHLPAFHLSFDGEDGYDERPYAELVAKHNGANLNVLAVNSSDLADNYENALWHAEIPFTNAHSVGKYLLCKFVQKNGISAVITGEGADEVFAGYPYSRRDMVLYDSHGQDQTTVAQLKQQLSGGTARYLENNEVGTTWVHRELGHGVSWLDGQAAIFDPLAGLYSDAFKVRHSNRDPYGQFYNRLRPQALADWSPVNRALYMVAKSSLPNIVLTSLGDRMEMAGSLGGRPPLLDYQVVESACRLSIPLKVRGRIDKYALREAMRPYLPHAIYARKKQYFRAPPASLRPHSRLHQLVQDTLASGLLNGVPFFDAGRVRGFVEKIPSLSQEQRSSADHLLMEIAGLCLMQKRFAIN